MPRKTTKDRPAGGDNSGIVLLPAPRIPRAINLNNLDAVRREMAKVYRDMRTRTIDSQDGARMIFALSQIGKMFELTQLERRIDALEEREGR